MSNQFIHINTYGNKSTSGFVTSKKGVKTAYHKMSIQDIIDEVLRKSGACDHVEKPQEKEILLHGVSAAMVPAMALAYAEKTKDLKGRKLRSDAQTCIAGVISCGPDDEENWEKIKSDSIKYLSDKYGSRLKSVVEHTDEAHPHIHFYVVPHAGERMDAIHEGLAARNVAMQAKEPAGAQNKAYRDAMRKFQTDYWLNVGLRNGLTKIGPGRLRSSRSDWKKNKDVHKEYAKILDAVNDFQTKDWSKIVQDAFDNNQINPQFIVELNRKLNFIKKHLALTLPDYIYTQHDELEAREKTLLDEESKLNRRQLEIEKAEKTVKLSVVMQQDLITLQQKYNTVYDQLSAFEEQKEEKFKAKSLELAMKKEPTGSAMSPGIARVRIL